MLSQKNTEVGNTALVSALSYTSGQSCIKYLTDKPHYNIYKEGSFLYAVPIYLINWNEVFSKEKHTHKEIQRRIWQRILTF